MLSSLKLWPLLGFYLVIICIVDCRELEKSNKISSLMRFIREKSAKTVNEVDDSELNDADLSHLTEQELLDEICSRMKYVIICKKSVEAMSRNYPEKLREIVETVRYKSKSEDARKLLRHKLIEFGLDKADEKGVNEAVNTLLDVVITRSLYGLAASKVVDVVSKYIV